MRYESFPLCTMMHNTGQWCTMQVNSAQGSSLSLKWCTTYVPQCMAMGTCPHPSNPTHETATIFWHFESIRTQTQHIHDLSSDLAICLGHCLFLSRRLPWWPAISKLMDGNCLVLYPTVNNYMENGNGHYRLKWL